MNEKLMYGLVGLLIGVLLTWVTLNNVNRLSTMSSNVLSQSDVLDAHFIEQMIPHHEDAITMAKLAQTQAKRPEVKQLSQNIIDSQGKEINQMKVWHKDWFGTDVPQGTPVMGQHGMTAGSGMHMGMMGDQSDMTRLEEAEDFDRAFVEHMIPHHQMAVMMATMLKNSTQRPEMKKLADDIISAQTKEINEMRQWYKTWGY